MHRVWKFEKGRNIEFYLFSGKLSSFSNFLNKGFEIKLAIIGTTVLVVRRSKTLKKCRTVNFGQIILKRLSFPDRFRPVRSEERKACPTIDMRVFFLSFLLKSARLIYDEAEPRIECFSSCPSSRSSVFRTGKLGMQSKAHYPRASTLFITPGSILVNHNLVPRT